jgi:hypothetical protein
LLIIAREQRLASIEFSEDAPQTPNIHFFGIPDPEDDLWRSVESTLDIGVDLLISEAARSEVDDFDLPAHGVDAKDILRLEIAMDDLVFLQEDQAFEDLHGVVSNLIGAEPHKPCGLEVLKEIGVEQLEDEAVVVSEEALVDHPHNIAPVLRVLLKNKLQVLSFLMGVLMVHLCVPGHFHCIGGLRGVLVVLAHDHLGE